MSSTQFSNFPWYLCLIFYYLCWSEDVQHVAVCGQHLEVYCLQDLVWGVELEEEHDKYPVIGDLLEFGSSHIMVDEEDSSNNAENFVKQVDLRINMSIL